jgi:hypothetical protein
MPVALRHPKRGRLWNGAALLSKKNVLRASEEKPIKGINLSMLGMQHVCCAPNIPVFLVLRDPVLLDTWHRIWLLSETAPDLQVHLKPFMLLVW